MLTETRLLRKYSVIGKFASFIRRVGNGSLWTLSHFLATASSPCRAGVETRYNTERMEFARFAIVVLETMFFVGLAGSAVVVLISFVEDAKELVGDE